VLRFTALLLELPKLRRCACYLIYTLQISVAFDSCLINGNGMSLPKLLLTQVIFVFFCQTLYFVLQPLPLLEFLTCVVGTHAKHFDQGCNNVLRGISTPEGIKY
jgi:hypothetical protein